jgi:hypothetical protein
VEDRGDELKGWISARAMRRRREVRTACPSPTPSRCASTTSKVHAFSDLTWCKGSSVREVAARRGRRRTRDEVGVQRVERVAPPVGETSDGIRGKGIRGMTTRELYCSRDTL